MTSKRLIIDTNLLISFLITKKLNELDKLFLDKGAILLLSQELLLEIINVINRPKFKKFFSEEETAQLLETFDQYGRLIAIKSDISLCRDKKDNFLLNLAVDGKADYLLTGDKDLLVLEKINKTLILSWSDFLKMTK